MRRLTVLATAALLSVGGAATVSAAPAVPVVTAGVPGSGIGIGLIDAPGQPYIVETLQPGAAITRYVRVSNNTGASRTVSVFATPAYMDSGVFTDDGAETTNALTSWMTIDRPALQLRDGEDKDVAVTITVPPDAPSGPVYASLSAVVEGASAGVRMYVTVGGDNGPSADFAVTDLVPQRRADGIATVLATVTNTGGRPIDLTGALRLTDGPDGRFTGTVSAQPATLAANATGTVLFVVPDSASLAAGPWTARTRLRNGYFTHDLNRQVTFPDVPSSGGGSTSSLGSLGSLSSFGSLGSSG